MTVRVVLAVLAALALVAAAQPAVDHARDTQQSAEIRASADRVADAVTDFHRRSDPGDSLATAPRTTLDLDLPTGAELRVRDDPARLVVVHGGTEHRRLLPVPVAVCGDRRTLRGPTTLAYVEASDGPVVVATRGFIGGEATTAAHACVL
ncbi:DUF7311 family protein [Halobacterium litoreum]|uniref:DUF7311 domain-containing protein n=1 Tax=Halobacterium litoreum TaxID=2039234 RepID=A0ABD5NH27_9EURY|nr:hypothetical protein [Halobacterium litoreum]UHH12775.1 hypothetical protein LT972_11465 [Halobacterium litoreum]